MLKQRRIGAKVWRIGRPAEIAKRRCDVTDISGPDVVVFMRQQIRQGRAVGLSNYINQKHFKT